jgi:hypothetical protein
MVTFFEVEIKILYADPDISYAYYVRLLSFIYCF